MSLASGSRIGPYDITALLGAGGTGRLRVRLLGVRGLAGTEGARTPLFSPDARWIAFLTESGSWKVPADGGAPTIVTPMSFTGLAPACAASVILGMRDSSGTSSIYDLASRLNGSRADASTLKRT